MPAHVPVHRAALVAAAILSLTSIDLHGQGQVLPPCTPGLTPGENILPVRNDETSPGVGTCVCVSDYGWSDTAFGPSIPDIYDQQRDLLSGDYAYNLRYSIGDVVVSGNGWLTVGMDAGRLVPSYATGSPWEVVEPVHYIEGTHMAQSHIRRSDHGLDLIITTLVDGSNVLTQTLQLTNNGSTPITFSGALYVNGHPNGSGPDNPALYQGTITFMPDGTLQATGPRDSTYIGDLQVFSSGLVDAHDTGFADPTDVIGRVETDTLNNRDQFGPDDAAGALRWSGGTLSPGESRTWSLGARFIF
jgi:hypothetical protein